MASSYLAALEYDARCFNCYSEVTSYQVQTYILSVISGLGSDPASLVSQSKCLSCLSKRSLVEIKLYLLAFGNGVTIIPSELVNWAKCFPCIPARKQQLQAYLLAQDPNGPGVTDQSALALAASGFRKLTTIELLQVQVYCLAIMAGFTSVDAAGLQSYAACMKCIPYPMLVSLQVSILEYLEPIPSTSDRTTIPYPSFVPPPYVEIPTVVVPPVTPPPPPTRGGGAHRGGGPPSCTDTPADLIPVLTPTYVAGSLTTVTAFVPRTCCTAGKLVVVGSNSVDMTGYATVTTVNEPNRTASWTSAAIDLSVYAYNYFAAQSDCQNGTILSSFSNVVGKTWLPQDSMETYTSGVALNGLNGGATWNGAYVARTAYIDTLASDTMETYTNGAAVNGLNGGTGWPSAYVAR